MVPGGRLTRVVVRENALKDDETDKEWRLLVDELVGYVNDLLEIGQYTADEIPALAMQAYHADYYLVQVINGGHSQFIGNSPATLKMTCSDALAGLESMGARTHHKILEDMMAWMEAHPDEADAQDGFSNRAAALEALDKRFDEAESIQPMSTLATLWIAAWPDLHVVSPNQYDFELERISQLNPHRAGRRLWKSVQMIRFQMTDPLQITIAAACGAARPIPEYKLRILPGLYMDVEGQQCLAFGVETEWGSRICIQEDGGGGRLYESSIRPLPDFEGILAADILKYGPRTVGARLSVVTSEKIQSFTAIAEKTLAAVAIDLLPDQGWIPPR